MKMHVCLALLLGAASGSLAGPNPDYDPHWALGDAWTVRVTFPQEFAWANGYSYVTNIVVDYRYVVGRTFESNGTALAVIEVVAQTNATHEGVSGIRDWRLYFNVGRMVLVGIDDFTSKRRPRAVSWLDVDWGRPVVASGPEKRIIRDFPLFPLGSTNEFRAFPNPDSDNLYLQESRFNTDRMWVGLTLSNVTRGVTMEWEKGRKWWSRATMYKGTNVVMTGVLLDDSK